MTKFSQYLHQIYGKISAFYKGAKKSKTASLNSSEYLSFSNLLLYKSPSDNYSINNAETIEIFYNIRTDIDKLNYATLISRMIYDVTEENIPSYDILQLFLNTLYTISETDKNLDLVLSIFKLRLLCILGFTPKIDKCVNCNEHEGLKYFSIRDNGIKCSACSKQDKSSIEMSLSTLNAIKYTVTAPPKKLYSFNIKDESLEEFKLITKIYFDNKLEKEYKIEDLF